MREKRAETIDYGLRITFLVTLKGLIVVGKAREGSPQIMELEIREWRNHWTGLDRNGTLETH